MIMLCFFFDSVACRLESEALSSPAVFAGGGKEKDQLAFGPFSHGPRNCIGMNLALTEIRTTVLVLIR